MGLGILGLYVLADPGASDAQSKEGQILIPFGKLFEKVCYNSSRLGSLLKSSKRVSP